MVARSLRLRGQDERRPAGGAAPPNVRLTRSVDRKSETTLRSSMGIFWIYRLSRLKRARVVKRFDKTQRTQASGD
jgi:hypothetical protein